MEIFHFSHIFETGGSEIYFNYANLKFSDMWKSAGGGTRDGRSLAVDRTNCDFLSRCFTNILSAPTLTGSGAQAINSSMEHPHDGLVCGDKDYKPQQQPIMPL